MLRDKSSSKRKKRKCENKHCHCKVVATAYCSEDCSSACDGTEVCTCEHRDCHNVACRPEDNLQLPEN